MRIFLSRDARLLPLMMLVMILDESICRACEQPGENYALLVGVRQYAEAKELRTLPYSENDMTELSQVLRAAGYRPENVVLMTQSAGAEQIRFMPFREYIRRELRLLLRKRSEHDTVLIALAGHGIHLKDDKESYFCPADAKLTDTTTLVPISEIYKELEVCGAGVKVLLVDACRNDPFLDKSRSPTETNVESVTRPVIPTPPGGIAAFFSCSEKEKAYEHDKLRHGVFFHYVIEGLKGAAASAKEDVTLLGLGEYVTHKVNDFVRSEYGVAQTPELLGRSRGLMKLSRVSPAVRACRHGKSLLDQGQYDEAIAELTEAIRLDPKCQIGYRERGVAYRLFIPNHEQAVADLSQAVELNREDGEALVQRGWAHLDGSDKDRALADFEQVLKLLKPQDTHAHVSRGHAYYGLAQCGQGSYDRAIAEYTEAIRLDPNDYWAVGSRGQGYVIQTKIDRAIGDFTEAIRINPKIDWAYLERAKAYFAKEQYDSCLADADETIRINSKNDWAFITRGQANQAKGDYKRAIADYTRAVHLNPRNDTAHNNRGNIYNDQYGDYARAIADYTEAIRVNPETALYYENRANSYESLGRPAQAAADRRTASRLKNP